MESIDFALLALRVLLGGLFVAHGLTKFTTRFQGFGLDGASGVFASWNYRPARALTVVAGLTELAAGLAFLAGFATPLASAAVVAVMLNTIRTGHKGNGLWYWNSGWEYNLTLAWVAAALAFAGPGEASLDDVIFGDVGGWGQGVAALALGIVSGAAALTFGRTRPEPATTVVQEQTTAAA
jgi:putative oxidoreductase